MIGRPASCGIGTRRGSAYSALQWGQTAGGRGASGGAGASGGERGLGIGIRQNGQTRFSGRRTVPQFGQMGTGMTVGSRPLP